jgi:carboxypeptidase family protein/TonB-dependent receptor-like protein
MKAAAASLAALLFASQLAAQPAGTLTGTVATADGTPVASARIRLLGTSFTTVADAKGGFRIADVPAAAHKLDVRMLGYSPLEQSIDVVAGTTFHVKVVLVPIPLEALEVVEKSAVTPGLIGFEERMARGPGTFFTREDILRMQARQFTDILRRVPGLQIRPVSGSYGNVSVQTRGSGCQTLFYMNGTAFPMPPDFPINNYVSADEVVGVEVYSSSEIPAQFNSSKNSRCGVIVIWTRVGPEPRRK